MTVTLLSAPIFTNAFIATGSGGVGEAAAGDSTLLESPHPTMKPAPASVVTFKNVRRFVTARCAKAQVCNRHDWVLELQPARRVAAR